MKTISVINPSQTLLAIMQNAQTEYVRTCHSDTCNCFSHDGGYDLVTGQVPDEVMIRTIGTSVHSHGTTIRIDDDEGIARLALADAARATEHASPSSNWSRAGERWHSECMDAERHARRMLELVRAGQTIESARIQATNEAAAAAKAARKAKREATIAGMEADGMTHAEATTAYGIGQWSNEVDWPRVKRTIIARGPSAHQELSNGANARSSREVQAEAGWCFPGSSFPRRTAWCTYACKIFFGWVREPQAEHPTRGNGWNLLPAK